MKRIVILASGSGTNAENIVKYFAGSNDVEIVSILESGEVTSIIRGMEPDLIVLSGFLLKVPESMVEAFPHKIINIHPALLPKFGGKGMYGDRVHEAVVAAGETESGITIHYIDENYDQGVTIFQAKCPVLPTDTPHDVATKVHALEYEWFPKIIEKLLS